MPSVSTDNITYEITTAVRGRNRQLSDSSQTASIPYLVEVTDVPSSSTDADQLEDWILASVMDYLKANPPHSLVYVQISDVEMFNLKNWRVVGEFASRGIWGNPDQVDIEFDTSGGQMHITSSIQTQASAGDKKDPRGVIGYDPTTGDVAGVDIPVAQFNWSIRRTIPITSAYVQTLFWMTGRVNLDWFQGFAPGTTLFLGASGRRMGDNYDITWRFSSLPNRIGDDAIIIPGLREGDEEIVALEKLGWDYLWVQYEEDVQNGKVYKKPVAAYTEQVLPYAMFVNLGLF